MSHAATATGERRCTKCRQHRALADFGSRARFNQCSNCRGGEAARRRDARRRRQVQDVEVDLAAGIKTCAQCRFTMPLDRFHADARRPDGRFPYCKLCRAERTGKADPQRQRYQDEYDFLTVTEAHRNATAVARDYYLRKNYGITTEDYDRLLEQQGGRCAICRCLPSESSRSTSRRYLHVDHDHTCCAASTSCGHCIRGLLCGRCNTAIGHFDDDEALIRAALAYLNGHAL